MVRQEAGPWGAWGQGFMPAGSGAAAVIPTEREGEPGASLKLTYRLEGGTAGAQSPGSWALPRDPLAREPRTAPGRRELGSEWAVRPRRAAGASLGREQRARPCHVFSRRVIGALGGVTSALPWGQQMNNYRVSNFSSAF